MKYYMIAGEKSGDLHGANLIKALKKEDPSAQFRSWGGDLMENAGADLVVHIRDLALMGIWEVLINLRKISGLLKMCKSDIDSYTPDVIILIDYGGFNMKIARFAQEAGFRVFYYITPKVWAWNTSRAWKIKKYVDRMFVILPFEKEFYKKFDWEVDYVGNPVVDAVEAFEADPAFVAPAKPNNGFKATIAVLPGSRKQEVTKILGKVAKVIRMNPQYQFLVAKVNSLPPELYAECESIDNARLIEEKTYDILNISDAAIVTSGTATLETALLKVPQVVVYQAGRITYLIGRPLVKITFISLVNLIANKEVVVELLQNKFSVKNVNIELNKLILDDSRRKSVLAGYNQVIEILGKENASKKTAALMTKYLSEF